VGCGWGDLKDFSYSEVTKTGCIQVGKRDFSKKPLKKLFIREEVFTLLPLDEYELKTMMRQTIIMITKA